MNEQSKYIDIKEEFRKFLIEKVTHLFNGKRLLIQLFTHLILGLLILSMIFSYMPKELVRYYSFLLGLLLSSFFAKYRLKKLRQEIKGNLCFQKSPPLIKRVIVVVILMILAPLLNEWISNNVILFNFILTPLAFPFPVSTIVLILWLIKYEFKNGPVFIRSVDWKKEI